MKYSPLVVTVSIASALLASATPVTRWVRKHPSLGPVRRPTQSQSEPINPNSNEASAGASSSLAQSYPHPPDSQKSGTLPDLPNTDTSSNSYNEPRIIDIAPITIYTTFGSPDTHPLPTSQTLSKARRETLGGDTLENLRSNNRSNESLSDDRDREASPDSGSKWGHVISRIQSSRKGSRK